MANTNSTQFTSIGNTNIGSGDYGLKFVANIETSLSEVTKSSGTTATVARILDSTYATIGTATFSGNIATFPSPIQLLQGQTYYVTINNGNSGFLADYGDVASCFPANNTDISFPLTGNAVFKSPYSDVITSLTVGGNQLGIVSVTTTSSVTPPPPPPPPTTTDSVVVYAGDSLVEGAAASFPYNHYLTVPTNYAQQNIGVSGKYIAAINTEATNYIDPLWGNNTNKIVVIWAGINDIFYGQSAQVTYDALKSFCLHEKSLGVKVIVLTTISHVTNSPNYSDVVRNAYNELIRANWTTFADGLADVAGNPNLGNNDSYASTVYFADQVHLTDTGYQLVAQIIQPVLDSIITPPAPPTYTLTQEQLTRLNTATMEIQTILSGLTPN